MRTILATVLLVILSILVDSTARIISAHAENKATAIVADADHGIIRILINGKEAARFTGSGLEVRDDIFYGGSITDTGSAHFDRDGGDSGAP